MSKAALMQLLGRWMGAHEDDTATRLLKELADSR
jgi:hypothetical protein